MGAPPPARRNTAIVASVFYFITIPFLILVLIGNIRNTSILTDIYFFRLDVSHIIPISVANSQLLNSVARSLGLHDFYQVGVWSFCEGYNDEGVTFCSKPKSFFWFNPVEVLVSELLAGAQIALPSNVNTVLDVLKIGSHVMYAFFLAGIVLNFVLMIITPLVMRSRWFSLAIALLGAIAALFVVGASAIATAISVAAKIALTAQDQLNISADIGVKMFAFMWIAAVFTGVPLLMHLALGCCCKPQKRDKSPRETPGTSMEETSGPLKLPKFVRRRRGAATSSSS